MFFQSQSYNFFFFRQNIFIKFTTVNKFSRLKFLLERACNSFGTKEDVLFNLGAMAYNKVQEPKIIEENSEWEKNSCGNIIETNGMQYNINEMNEKEVIELMLILHDKLSIELLDEQKAEKRLQEIEKENELQELDKQIEDSEYEEEQILRMAERIKQRNKEKVLKENKELEAIAKRNIANQTSVEEQRRKNALNSLKTKFNEHNA